MDELININEKDLKKFIFEDMNTYCKVYNIYDGDTICIIFKYKDEYIKYSCRINGIDTPEIKSKNDNIKKLAYNARDFLRDKILNKIIKIDILSFDKYGRLLINAYTLNNESISDLMIKNGYAKSYDGGTKDKWE